MCDELSDLIPRPGVIRHLLAKNVREAARLRELLKISLRAHEDRAFLHEDRAFLADLEKRIQGRPTGES